MIERLAGTGIETYTDWKSFWARITPLGRRLLTNHDDAGKEIRSPELTPEFYQERFFSGDCVGIVDADPDGTVVTASVLKQLDRQTVEHVLRLGTPARHTFTRRAMWDLGIRFLEFDRKSEVDNLGADQARQARRSGNVPRIPSPLPGYVRRRVTFTRRPEKDTFDD
jgi:hypothetical protein